MSKFHIKYTAFKKQFSSNLGEFGFSCRKDHKFSSYFSRGFPLLVLNMLSCVCENKRQKKAVHFFFYVTDLKWIPTEESPWFISIWEQWQIVNCLFHHSKDLQDRNEAFYFQIMAWQQHIEFKIKVCKIMPSAVLL